jgi:methionyl-tRNA formyltransferase
MLSIAKLANVGFHPTPLPRGRGRAPVAWLILEQMDGAATFFAVRDGVDDGPIYVQIPFSVGNDDDAAAVYQKVLEAEAAALDEWLPKLKAGHLRAAEQDNDAATWFGRRGPEDGLVDWSAPRYDILRLIRASAPPHPGAYSFSGDVRVEIQAAIIEDRMEKGVLGRILSIEKDLSFVIQAGDGLIRVTTWNTETDWQPRVGLKLGYHLEAEVYALRGRMRALEATVVELQRRLGFLERKN